MLIAVEVLHILIKKPISTLFIEIGFLHFKLVFFRLRSKSGNN